MKKPILLAPRQSTREITSDVDADRLLASGSWVKVASTKKPSPGTVWQREFRQRRLAEGYGFLHVLLPGAVLDALHDQKKEGETMAELIERLIGNAGRNR